MDMSLLLAKIRDCLWARPLAPLFRPLDRASLPDMCGKTIVVIAPSSGVRYIQHPMFKSIRDEALGALAEPDTNKSRNGRVKEEWRPASDADEQRSDESMSDVCQRRLDLVERVESCILALVRTLLVPEIEATHNLIDYGATSLTAMMLLGKIRPALDGVLEGAEIRGLKLAVIKESCGDRHEILLTVYVIDTRGVALKQDDTLGVIYWWSTVVAETRLLRRILKCCAPASAAVPQT